MYDFFYKKKMILYTKMWCVMGMGEKTPKIPRLVALPSPFLGYGSRLVFDVQEHRNQAGPTLNGRGV